MQKQSNRLLFFFLIFLFIQNINAESYEFVLKWPQLPEGWDLNSPCGIAVNSSGNVYVADCDNARIQKFRLATSIYREQGVVTPCLSSYPNPFNPECYIPYEVQCSMLNVKIKIYNILGQVVKELDLGEKQAGNYVTKDKAAYWDGKDNNGKILSSGVYFYQL